MTAELGKNRLEELEKGASYEVGDLLEIIDQHGVLMVYRVDKLHEDSLVATNIFGSGFLLQPFSFFDRFVRGKRPKLLRNLNRIIQNFNDIEIPCKIGIGDRHNDIIKMFREGIEAFFYDDILNSEKLYKSLFAITNFRSSIFEIKHGEVMTNIEKVRLHMPAGIEKPRDVILTKHRDEIKLIHDTLALIAEVTQNGRATN